MPRLGAARQGRTARRARGSAVVPAGARVRASPLDVARSDRVRGFPSRRRDRGVSVGSESPSPGSRPSRWAPSIATTLPAHAPTHAADALPATAVADAGATLAGREPSDGPPARDRPRAGHARRGHAVRPSRRSRLPRSALAPLALASSERPIAARRRSAHVATKKVAAEGRGAGRPIARPARAERQSRPRRHRRPRSRPLRVRRLRADRRPRRRAPRRPACRSTSSFATKCRPNPPSTTEARGALRRRAASARRSAQEEERRRRQHEDHADARSRRRPTAGRASPGMSMRSSS